MTDQNDSLAAATKKDLQGFTNVIMTALQDLESRMNTRFEAMDIKLDTKIDESEGRMLLAIENLRHDMIGTHNDKISQHEDRIVRIEKHLHLTA